MARRMSDAQKRCRIYARYSGKQALRYIAKAAEHQQDASWYAGHEGFEYLAPQWQRLSDQAVDFAASNARRAASWALRSQECL